MIDALQVVGGGKMGTALVAGLIDSQAMAATSVTIVEPYEARRIELANELPDVELTETPLRDHDTVIAVKPDHVVEVCAQLSSLGVRRVLSIAAGVTIATLEGASLPIAAVVRAMPNTPALVSEGMAAIAAGTHATDSDMAWADNILGAVGRVVTVSEPELDAVTGVSGSGPAYLFAFAEALVAAAVDQGLSADTATLLVDQTLLGAATLLCKSDSSATTLRENVTSPNGTTAAGLAVFSDAGLDAMVTSVVAAATARSRELGRG
jgi:pyrroline-5-carboxylate reductase